MAMVDNASGASHWVQPADRPLAETIHRSRTPIIWQDLGPSGLQATGQLVQILRGPQNASTWNRGTCSPRPNRVRRLRMATRTTHRRF